MPKTHLRSVDLNLLSPLQALLEERSVTRAAKRVHLSQPAMSRALERLRFQLRDDLLIRNGAKHELTPRAIELVQELGHLIPRLEQLWEGVQFTPAHATGVVRISMTDYAAALTLSGIALALQQQAPNVRLDVTAWHSRSFEDLTSGKVDLVLSPLAPPPTLASQPLFEETFVCLVRNKHPHRAGTFSLENYLQQRHVSIETEEGQQTLVDRRLAETGAKRIVSVQLPFFMPSLLAICETDLVLTAPSMLARTLSNRYSLRAVKAPRELAGFSYMMMWHPRLKDAPLHIWFRDLLTASVQRAVAEQTSTKRSRRN